MVARRLLLVPLLLLAAAPAAAEEIDTWTPLVEQRKDVVLARLAACETHGTAVPSERNGYFGPFQFSTGTVIAFVRERDGRTIGAAEAQALARDEVRSAALARYVIFERNGVSHWPGCSRKLGLARQVSQIGRP
jgi:hypothetical protein